MKKTAIKSGGLAATLLALVSYAALQGGCEDTAGSLGGSGGTTSSATTTSSVATTSTTSVPTTSTSTTSTSTTSSSTTSTSSTTSSTTSTSTTSTGSTSSSTTTDTTTSTSSTTSSDSGTGGSTGSTGPTVDPSLLLHYTFDEGTGTTADDASGHGNAGTLQGSASWAAPGHIGGAVLLSGTDPHVLLPPNLLDGHDSVTIAAWINLTSLDPWTRIFDFGGSVDAGGHNADFMFLTPTDGKLMRLDANNTTGAKDVVVTTNQLLGVGSWHHLAFRAAPFDVPMAGYELWLDGNLVAFTPAAGNARVLLSHLTPTPTNYLGKSHFPDQYLKGMIDDFRIYARALDPAEIGALAAQ